MAYKIYLYDTDQDCIGSGCLCSAYIQFQLQEAAGQDVEVHISSVGGSAFDAIAIYDLFKKYQGKLTTHIDALAASAASIVAMAGQQVFMSKYALLMIHKPMVGSGGNADDLMQDVGMLNSVQTRLAAIYVDKTGLPLTTINDMINAVTWIDADMALELGFIDSIEDYEPVMAKNAPLLTNYIQTAPAKFKQVINQILIQKPAAIAPTTNEMTKEEVEAIVKPTQTALQKVLNYFKKSTTKVTTNKGDLFLAGNLVVGTAAYNSADLDEDAEDDEDMDATDAAGKKVKMSVKNGKVTKVDPDEDDDDDSEDDDDDMDADNKAVLNSVGIKHGKDVTNKSVKNEMAKKIAESIAIVNSQNSLLAEMRTQLQVANEAIQKREEDIKEDIKSEFTPNNSKRSNKATADINAAPEWLKLEGVAKQGAALAVKNQKK